MYKQLAFVVLAMLVCVSVTTSTSQGSRAIEGHDITLPERPSTVLPDGVPCVVKCLTSTSPKVNADSSETLLQQCAETCNIKLNSLRERVTLK